ncbi:MAG: hypothetical protein FD180_4170 [Planctomycetota bacterium]|nr:MAG: hypothetical protein FD180_4170 [Planctomycetota bacterium]
MTTMNKIRAWSFAAFVGALALADWQVPNLVADGEEIAMPKAEVNGVKVTAAVKEVNKGGCGVDKIEKHWIVSLDGDGKGELTLTCTKTPWEPMSRMMPSPAVVWTKTLPFDTSASRTIDLGLAPEAEAKASFALVLGKAGSDIEASFTAVRLAHVAPLKGKNDIIEFDEEAIEDAVAKTDDAKPVTK